jgi:hypothetical protein
LKSYQPLIIYLLIFLSLSIVLDITGILNIDKLEIISYGFIFFGIGLVYVSFSREQNLILFFGSMIFLTGIVLFLLANFEFRNTGELFIPSIFFIIGFAFLMVFLNNTESRILLYFSLILIIIGTGFTAFLGSLTVENFLISFLNIASKYWLIILVVLGIILLIKFEERRK